MPIGPDATFVEKWNDEALDEYTQKRSLLFDTVNIVEKRASKLHIPIWEHTEANIGRERNQMLEISAQNSFEVELGTQLISKVFMIDDYDQAQSDYNYRQNLTRQAVSAVWRAFDDITIGALNASATAEVTLPNANTFDYEGAEAMAKALDQAEVDESERYCAISSGAKQDLRVDTTIINNFHNPNDTVRTGMIHDVAGFDMATTQRLPNGDAGATERRVFAYHKMAVTGFINQPFQINIDYENLYAGWSIVATMGYGALINREPGVRFADVVEN